MKAKKSILSALNGIDWAWLILIALGITVLMCMVIGAANKSSKPVAETASTETVKTIAYHESYVAPEYHDEIPPRTYVGTCRLTVYTPTESHWGYTTATGAKSQHLMTCAVDPKVIPYGSNVIIVAKDGSELRLKAVDCGNFTGKWVDIFFDGTERHGIEWLDENFGEWGDVYIEEVKK